MKRIMLIVIAGLLATVAKAQSTDSTGNAIAGKFSGKMKDSLNLSEGEYSSVYAINELLHIKRIQVWQQHSPDSVQYFLQRIENTRDSLYSTVLPPDKFLLYKEKKTRIINNQ